MHVVISIVAWNSMKYLPEALASLDTQTYRDFTLVIVDNASSDGVEEFVRGNHPRAGLIRNTKNLGFARAHNQAIAYAKARIAPERGDILALVMNPDAVLEPTFLEEAVRSMTLHPEAGSVSGKLLRMKHSADELSNGGEKTFTVDSAGLRIRKTRRMDDRGAGEQDGTDYDRGREIFGPSGALGLYRLSALESVAYPVGGPTQPGQLAVEGREEYFDEDFFAYKEDLDLAWRLRLAGWTSWYEPRAVAYHYRTARGRDRASYLSLGRNRRNRSPLVKFLSYRNSWLVLMKNDQLRNQLIDLPRIAWYETGKFIYALILEPRTLKAVPSALALWPKMRRKRAHIMRTARTSAKEIRKWFA